MMVTVTIMQIAGNKYWLMHNNSYLLNLQSIIIISANHFLKVHLHMQFLLCTATRFLLC